MYFKKGNNLLRLICVHQWNGLDETSIGLPEEKKVSIDLLPKVKRRRLVYTQQKEMSIDFLPKVAVDWPFYFLPNTTKVAVDWTLLHTIHHGVGAWMPMEGPVHSSVP
jgi:hypothetical protein